jgi:hypothetical protein
MTYHKLTNTTEKELRGIFTQEGYVTLKPGESRVVDVADADLKANADYFKAEKASEKDANEQEAADGLGELQRVNPAQPLPEGADDTYAAMSEDQLRDEIEDKTGKRPHHNTGRDKLIEQHKAL